MENNENINKDLKKIEQKYGKRQQKLQQKYGKFEKKLQQKYGKKTKIDYNKDTENLNKK